MSDRHQAPTHSLFSAGAAPSAAGITAPLGAPAVPQYPSPQSTYTAINQAGHLAVAAQQENAALRQEFAAMSKRMAGLEVTISGLGGMVQEILSRLPPKLGPGPIIGGRPPAFPNATPRPGAGAMPIQFASSPIMGYRGAGLNISQSSDVSMAEPYVEKNIEWLQTRAQKTGMHKELALAFRAQIVFASEEHVRQMRALLQEVPDFALHTLFRPSGALSLIRALQGDHRTSGLPEVTALNPKEDALQQLASLPPATLLQLLQALYVQSVTVATMLEQCDKLPDHLPHDRKSANSIQGLTLSIQHAAATMGITLESRSTIGAWVHIRDNLGEHLYATVRQLGPYADCVNRDNALGFPEHCSLEGLTLAQLLTLIDCLGTVWCNPSLVTLVTRGLAPPRTAAPVPSPLRDTPSPTTQHRGANRGTGANRTPVGTAPLVGHVAIPCDPTQPSEGQLHLRMVTLQQTDGPAVDTLALIDSGAQPSIISHRVATDMGMTEAQIDAQFKAPGSSLVRHADGQSFSATSAPLAVTMRTAASPAQPLNVRIGQLPHEFDTIIGLNAGIPTIVGLLNAPGTPASTQPVAQDPQREPGRRKGRLRIVEVDENGNPISEATASPTPPAPPHPTAVARADQAPPSSHPGPRPSAAPLVPPPSPVLPNTRPLSKPQHGRFKSFRSQEAEEWARDTALKMRRAATDKANTNLFRLETAGKSRGFTTAQLDAIRDLGRILEDHTQRDCDEARIAASAPDDVPLVGAAASAGDDIDIPAVITSMTQHVTNQKTLAEVTAMLTQFLTPASAAELARRRPFVADIRDFPNAANVRSTIQQELSCTKRIPSNSRIAELFREKIATLVRLGILEPIPRHEARDHLYAYAFAIPKGPDAIRFVVDLVEANRLALRLSTNSQPVVEQAMAFLRKTTGNEVYHELDLTDAFFGIALPEETRRLFGISTQDGRYRFTALPMGYADSSVIFQNAMTAILHDLIVAGKVFVYIDNILIKGEGQDEAAALLQEVLRRLTDRKFRVNLRKCKLFQSEISTLGIFNNGIWRQFSQESLDTVLALPDTVSTRPKLHSLVASLRYYGHFVHGLHELLKPLSDLLDTCMSGKGNVNALWKAHHTEAVLAIKAAIKQAPPLWLFDPTRPITIRTDASDIGIGGELLQLHGDTWRPVFLFSHAFNTAEQKWQTPEKECYAIFYAIRKWRDYLYCSDFTIETDHKNLIFMRDSVNVKVRNWWSTLCDSGYRCTVKHIEGTSNVIADMLSRFPLELGLHDPVAEEPGAAPRTSNATPLVAAMQTAPQPAAPPFAEAASLAPTQSLADALQRANIQAPEQVRRSWREMADSSTFQTPHGEVIGDKNGHIRIQGSDLDTINRCLVAAHDNSFHQGIRRTLGRLRNEIRVTWNNMSDDAANYVRSCQRCQLHRTRQDLNVGELLRDHCTTPLGTVQMDLAGPWTESSSGNKYLVVMTDEATRTTVLYAVPDTSCESATNALRHGWIKYYQNPRAVKTDNATTFTGGRFQAFLASRNIKSVLNTPYNPGSHAIAERTIQVVQNAINTSTDKPEEWDSCLSDIQPLCNAAVNASTGLSAFETLHGALPVTTLMASAAAFDPPITVSDMVLARHKAREFANANDANAHLQRKKRFDAERKSVEYKPEQMVLVRNESPADRSAPAWHPHRVVEQLTAVTYLLEHPVTKRSFKAHVRRLRPYDASRTTEDDLVRLQLKEGEWLASHVTEHKFVRRYLHLHISWTDAPDQPSWEPLSGVKALDCVKAYMTQHDLRPDGRPGKATREPQSRHTRKGQAAPSTSTPAGMPDQPAGPAPPGRRLRERIQKENAAPQG